jgi:hypothetical protein
VFSQVSIPNDARWRFCIGLASVTFVGSLVWLASNLGGIADLGLFGAKPSGFAMRFASSAMHGLLGGLAVLLYMVSFVLLLRRATLFLPLYMTASGCRFFYWLSQVQIVEFPAVVGFFMLAADLAVIGNAGKWYLETRRQG